MKGQWLGNYIGTTAGMIIANIDERPTDYNGVAYLNQNDPKFPNTVIAFHTKNKEKEFPFRSDSIANLDSGSRMLTTDELQKIYGPDVVVTTYADVVGSVKGDSLTLSWTTDGGVNGSGVLTRSMAAEPSQLASQNMDWAEFKAHMSTLVGKRYLFRGQSEPWRLRTSFHRKGRADLARFLNEDVPVLRRHLSARVKHVFNLANPDENGAFFNLIQHHGYPTPLLDWTYSPYVAAFFAYRGTSNEKASGAAEIERVRIHVLDQQTWQADFRQPLMVVSPGLYFSVGEFLAIENERMVPQQAASTVANVDDIESYIRDCETRSGKAYLSAIDLPLADRKRVVDELAYMGITAGSMFPGLDGACEELCQRNFEI